MPCRIGITTDLEERKSYWRSQYPNMKNWTVLETHDTKEAAQAAENRLAIEHDCEAYAGGKDAAGPWYVYKFDY